MMIIRVVVGGTVTFEDPRLLLHGCFHMPGWQTLPKQVAPRPPHWSIIMVWSWFGSFLPLSFCFSFPLAEFGWTGCFSMDNCVLGRTVFWYSFPVCSPSLSLGAA